jgi:hypothetical protein
MYNEVGNSSGVRNAIGVLVLQWNTQSFYTQAVVIAVSALFFVFVRRRYFSSSSGIPGPFLASFSRLWHVRTVLAGDSPIKLIEAHDRYGTHETQQSITCPHICLIKHHRPFRPDILQ